METRNPTILSRIEIEITRRRETKVELSQLTIFDGDAGLISNREKKRIRRGEHGNNFARRATRVATIDTGLPVSPLRLLPGIHGDVAMADVDVAAPASTFIIIEFSSDKAFSTNFGSTHQGKNRDAYSRSSCL